MPEKRQNIKKLTETGFIPVCLIVKNRQEKSTAGSGKTAGHFRRLRDRR